MSFTKTCAAVLMAVGVLTIAAMPTQAALVHWNVDPTQSFVRLNIPDQEISIDGATVTLRIRNSQNTAAWSDAGGRRAFLDGTIATNLSEGNSISILGGQSSLMALESGSFRPNPAAFDPDATNTDNPDGQYMDTSGAPAAFAATARAATVILFPTTIDIAKIAFRNVEFGIDSGILALDGGGAFAGGWSFGIDSSEFDADAVTSIAGQPIPDVLGLPLGMTGVNSGGGAVTIFGGLNYQLTIDIDVPIQFELDGTPLNASLTGTIVAIAMIPEPSSALLAGFAALGLCCAGRCRFCRR